MFLALWFGLRLYTFDETVGLLFRLHSAQPRRCAQPHTWVSYAICVIYPVSKHVSAVVAGTMSRRRSEGIEPLFYCVAIAIGHIARDARSLSD